jgi:hypothetical protein
MTSPCCVSVPPHPQRLKAKTKELEETVLASQELGKHVPTATTKGLLDAVFSMQSKSQK